MFLGFSVYVYYWVNVFDIDDDLRDDDELSSFFDLLEFFSFNSHCSLFVHSEGSEIIMSSSIGFFYLNSKEPSILGSSTVVYLRLSFLDLSKVRVCRSSRSKLFYEF